MDETVVDEYNASSSFYLPVEDEEQRKEINEEQAMVSGAKPMFEEIIAWFDAELTWASSIEGLDVESKAELTTQVLAKQRYAKFMIEAKQRLVTLSHEHLEA